MISKAEKKEWKKMYSDDYIDIGAQYVFIAEYMFRPRVYESHLEGMWGRMNNEIRYKERT